MHTLNTENFVFFFTKYSVFSNFYQPASFVLNGVKFNCSEQCFMAAKAYTFNDLLIYQQIMEANDPKEQKRLGRLIKGFDVELWNRISYNAMFRACMAKFSQNSQFKQMLLETGDKCLVEASPYDGVWGIKLGIDNPDIFDRSKWQGLNRLGNVLNEVRNCLK